LPILKKTERRMATYDQVPGDRDPAACVATAFGVSSVAPIPED